jgi:hypothetical protein
MLCYKCVRVGAQCVQTIQNKGKTRKKAKSMGECVCVRNLHRMKDICFITKEQRGTKEKINSLNKTENHFHKFKKKNPTEIF